MPLWTSVFPSVVVLILIGSDLAYCAGYLSQVGPHRCKIVATATWTVYYAIVTARAVMQAHLLVGVLGVTISGVAAWLTRRTLVSPSPRRSVSR